MFNRDRFHAAADSPGPRRLPVKLADEVFAFEWLTGLDQHPPTSSTQLLTWAIQTGPTAIARIRAQLQHRAQVIEWLYQLSCADLYARVVDVDAQHSGDRTGWPCNPDPRSGLTSGAEQRR